MDVGLEGTTTSPPGSEVNTPLVSVVVPVYEQPDLLQEALESVATQTLADVEVVVVDDASEMDLKPVLDEFDIRTVFVRHKTNEGAAAARNTGIDAANGEYIAFLDADDLWKSTKLERQLAVFERGNDSLGLVYTGFVQYETDGSEWVRHPEARGEIYEAELERDRIHPTSTVMVRQDILQEVGGFDASLPSRQDYDLWIRITEHYEVDYVDQILVDKREQEGGISKNFDSRIQGDLAVFKKVKERVSEYGFIARSRILSYHHHVIGRDYESRGDRLLALKHLGLAVLQYPFRPISWVMFGIALLGIDRNGPVLSFAKQFVR
jgi:glycosyltransferase involved in cell wall biosynthesis